MALKICQPMAHNLRGLCVLMISILFLDLCCVDALQYNKPFCWGHEPGCVRPAYDFCSSEKTKQSRSSREQTWNMHDWGYVASLRHQMHELCEDGAGSLKCTMGTGFDGRYSKLVMCEARGVAIDFAKRITPQYVMYNEWPNGGLAIACNKFNPAIRLGSEKGNCGMSWALEFNHTASLPVADINDHSSSLLYSLWGFSVSGPSRTTTSLEGPFFPPCWNHWPSRFINRGVT